MLTDPVRAFPRRKVSFLRVRISLPFWLKSWADTADRVDNEHCALDTKS